MLPKLKILYQYFASLGFINGLLTYTKISLGYSTDIKIPQVKYSFSLRKGTSDIPTFKQVFIAKEYNISLNNPKIIIDCGANIGLFTILMKTRYQDAKIICVEPDPENFDLLKKNAASYDNIYCENCGIWNKVTVLKVFDKYGRGKWGMMVEEDTANGTIPAMSIKGLMEKYSIDHIDVLKIDIEASEKHLFADNFQEWLPKVKLIIIEIHDWMEAGCSKPFFEAINKAFSKYSYSHKGGNVIIENTSDNGIK